MTQILSRDHTASSRSEIQMYTALQIKTRLSSAQLWWSSRYLKVNQRVFYTSKYKQYTHKGGLHVFKTVSLIVKTRLPPFCEFAVFTVLWHSRHHLPCLVYFQFRVFTWGSEYRSRLYYWKNWTSSDQN